MPKKLDLDVKNYRQKTKKKLEIYKELDLSLVKIFPQDDIRQKLIPLLKYSESQKILDDFQIICP